MVKREKIVYNNESNKERTDHDSLFKELIKTFFADFIETFFPEVYPYIDFSHLKFLMQEFAEKGKNKGKQRVDLLAETKIKGEDGLVLVHIENQAQAQPDFEKRMLYYFSHIFYEHGKRILPFAVFSYDEETRDEPDNIHIEFPFLQVMDFNFLTLELKKKNWREYIDKKNPVVVALLGKMKYDRKEKVQVKFAAVRIFVDLKLRPEHKKLLFRFSQAYLMLDEQENQEFDSLLRNELLSEEVEEYMGSVFIWNEESWEDGRLKGVAEGWRESLAETAIRQLKKKFGKLSRKYLNKIKAQDRQTLQSILDDIFDLQSPEDLDKYFK